MEREWASIRQRIDDEVAKREQAEAEINAVREEAEAAFKRDPDAARKGETKRLNRKNIFEENRRKR